MSNISRRKAMALGVAAPATGMAFPLGQEIDGRPGLLVRLAWQRGRWEVLVPDWDVGPWWHPGMVFPTKWIALSDYLEEIEREFKLVPQA